MKIEQELGKIKVGNYALKTNLNTFEINKIYIATFLKILWNYPEAVYIILKNADKEIIEKNLGKFIMNNFFNNYMGSSKLENNLLYVLTMMIKEEINSFVDIPQINTFLEKSKASFLLKEMINFPEVQLYFKKIIFQMVEKMENDYSSKKMNFNLTQIHQELKDYINEENKKLNKKNKKSVADISKQFINMKLNEQSMNTLEDNEILDDIKIKKGVDLDESFLGNTINIKLDDLEELIKDAEKNNKLDLKHYYLYLCENIKMKSANDLYSNIFLEKFASDKEININYLLYIYQFYFTNIISILDIFFKDLFDNASIIPDSIKYICKIISVLIKNKYKDIPKYLENAFISKFFIDKLLIPILQNPSFNALLNDFIISGNTTSNINIVIYIVKKIFSGKLFQINSILPDGEEEQNLTIFNKYIMNTMENTFTFYEKLINISLPPFIDKYINNSLPSDYTYDYFKENPDEIYGNISICFNLTNLICLIKSLKKGEEEFFLKENNKNNKLKRIFNKLKSEEKLKELIKLNYNKGKDPENRNSIKPDNNKNSKKVCNVTKPENYYILNENLIEENYENIFKISNKISGFYIDIKKLEKDKKLEEKEKNLVKFKNFLINSLKNYKLLKISSFKSTQSIYAILLQIKNFMAFPTLNHKNIDINWSISSVLNYMNKIPDEYKENDYEKCFEELTQDLQESIAEFDFDKLFIFQKNFEQLEKIQEFYKEKQKVIEDINANNKARHFIEDFFLPIELKFFYLEDEKKFELKKSNIKEKSLKDSDILEMVKKDKIIVRNISSFIRYFPDLNKYQNLLDISPFQIMGQLEINKKLIYYFDIIRATFIQGNICSEEEYDNIYDLKIINFIMNKLYKKIYPKELEYDDSRFFEKTMHLSWVEPSMIIKGDTTLDALDNILPDILLEFKNLNSANSPYTKFACIKKIFELIGKIVKVNDDGEGGSKDIGAEDITPYLNFVLIRACPVKIFSDIKFVKFFLKDEGKMEYDFLNVEIMCKNILESTYKDYNVSESEFIKKCNHTLSTNKTDDSKRFQEIIDRFEKVGSFT